LPTHLKNAGRVTSVGAGRVLVQQRLGHLVPSSRRRRFSAPDVDGWRDVLPRVTEAGCSNPKLGVGSFAASTVPRPSQKQLSQVKRIPAELLGRCLSYSHASSSDLPAAMSLSTVSRIWAPRQGL
jgi:hypothetical protein